MKWTIKKAKKADIDLSRLPRHIAIVMDGNGRWAQKRGLPRKVGHAEGSENFRRIATYCKEIGIEYLTIYAFSTENWKRPKEEVDAIMALFPKYLDEALDTMEKDKVKMAFFGDLEPLSNDIKSRIEKAVEKSRHFEGVQVNICINYGGRDEILQAVRKMAQACLDGRLGIEQIDEKFFSHAMYSAGIPDPDLIIRPGGEMRLSNFLLWQAAYAELYFTPVLWPDFDNTELDRAIAAYQSRLRRYGGV